jgi:hypothetical protein
MESMSLRRTLRSAVLGGLVAVLAAGCASIGAGSRPAEEVVQERAQARWNALVKRDWATAYSYLTPGYRAVVPQERYASQFVGPVKWTGAEAREVKCEEKRCVVQVEIFFRLQVKGHRNRDSSTHVEETWVLEDRQWFKFEKV